MNLKASLFYLGVLIFFFTFLVSTLAFAEIEIGSGNSSMTGGRFVPSIDLAYLQNNNVLAWSGTGVKSGYYYQSSHQLSYFKSWKAGDMWGGDVNSGFGGSVAYTTRAFQDEGSTLEQKDSDFLLGPAIRMNLSYGFFYINMSATFGIRNVLTHAMSLTFQDVESLSVGVRF